jgi:endonuclease/exonuclease/phosphatase family metal-dependent hydrolase
VISGLIQFNDFDVMGLQEVLHGQLTDLLGRLPAYGYVGVGRDDGKEKGEYSPIFYKKDHFVLLKSGHFWLSAMEDRPNKGWDAEFPRICTWARFRDKSNGANFWFFNLHMDHHGVVARRESAGEVLKYIDKMCGMDAVILTGDFNANQTSEVYHVMLNSGKLRDSYGIAGIRYALNGTVNHFNPNKQTESRIDHIFVSSAWKVDRYGVLTDTYRSPAGTKDKPKNGNTARMPSDHFPVKVVLEYAK